MLTKHYQKTRQQLYKKNCKAANGTLLLARRSRVKAPADLAVNHHRGVQRRVPEAVPERRVRLELQQRLRRLHLRGELATLREHFEIFRAWPLYTALWRGENLPIHDLSTSVFSTFTKKFLCVPNLARTWQRPGSKRRTPSTRRGCSSTCPCCPCSTAHAPPPSSSETRGWTLYRTQIS